MEIIVLLLFLAVFYYLGTRLLRHRGTFAADTAGGTINPMTDTTGRVDNDRFQRANTGDEVRPRQPVGSAIRGTRPGIADTSDSIG